MRSPRLIVVVVSAVLAGPQAAPAAPTPQARIINGYEAAPGAWPAQTAVRVTTQMASYACGGTLVSARWVLTAGHCVDDEAGQVLPAGAFNNIRIGGTTRGNGDLAIVDRVERHPSFRAVEGPQTGRALYFDVALLHLAARAVKEPIRMIGTGDSEASLWRPGAEATVIGWGWTTPTGSPSTTLREAKMPVRADPDCAAAWGDLYRAESLLCAGGSNVDTCPGDSGGPLMVPRVGGFAIAGITSWGALDCGTPGAPGMYARLAAPAISAWVRERVPAISFTTSPPTPVAGAPVTLTAVAGPAGGAPAVSWDVNGDGNFNDATGPSVSMTFPGAGAYTIAMRAEYSPAGDPPDGDGSAIARDAVGVADPPPPPPPPAPPPPPPSPPPVAAPRTFTNGVGVTPRMKLATLRTRGVRVRFECERACTIRGRLTLGPVSARRFGLGRAGRSVTIASGTRRLLEAGRGTLTLKLSARATRALRNRPRATISVTTELRTASARLPARHTVSVRR